MTIPTRDAVLAQLGTVLDPCSIGMGVPVNLEEMGLVEEVRVDSGHVHVRLVLTDTSCVFFGDIRRHVVDAIRVLEGVDDVAVEIDASIMWTPDRAHSALSSG